MTEAMTGTDAPPAKVMKAINCPRFTLPSLNMLKEPVVIALPVGVICILVVLSIPMSTWMLDFSLTLSIAFSVLALMTVLFVRTPLELNTFPTILLVATMLQLALNLASTCLILADADQGTAAAGHVIEAFGNFSGGDAYVIGIMVFAILVIIKFVVITKGAERITEVATRFSLGAMPGKQMAIDADPSAGLIDEEQARDRREKLAEENSFYGAMDGASKFVRGGAIDDLLSLIKQSAGALPQ